MKKLYYLPITKEQKVEVNTYFNNLESIKKSFRKRYQKELAIAYNLEKIVILQKQMKELGVENQTNYKSVSLDDLKVLVSSQLPNIPSYFISSIINNKDYFIPQRSLECNDKSIKILNWSFPFAVRSGQEVQSAFLFRDSIGLSITEVNTKKDTQRFDLMKLRSKDCEFDHLIYFDGACVPNPGEMGIGVHCISKSTEKVHQISKSIGMGTNNIAEYTAFLEALKLVKSLGLSNFKIQGDSLLVINAVLGKQKQKINPKFDALIAEITPLMKYVIETNSSVEWCGRSENAIADELSTRCLRSKSWVDLKEVKTNLYQFSKTQLKDLSPN